MSNEGVSSRYIIEDRLAVIPIHAVMSDMGLLWIENPFVETQDTSDNYATITPQTGMSNSRIKQYDQAARSKYTGP